jgi:hypothetical protein
MTHQPSHLSVVRSEEQITALIEQLHHLPAGRRIDHLISQTNPKQMIRAIPPREIYTIIRETGLADAAAVIPFLSPQQMTFCMDFELWREYDFDRSAWHTWLPVILEAGEDGVRAFVEGIDRELLLLLLSEEVEVAGGFDSFINDDERLREWDHTFDNLYFLSFTSEEQGPLAGQLLAIIRATDQQLYLWLMEGIMGISLSEQEELCCQFRLGRLEDLGFPQPLEARSIYAPLSPGAFRLLGDKTFPLQPEASAHLSPQPLPQQATLLDRLLAGGVHPFIHEELNYLANAALIAEGNPFGEPELAAQILERVHGMVTIALEHLSKGDGTEALRILESEPLSRLFQLGNALVMELGKELHILDSSDYATGRLVLGMKQARPRYYRGLDPDSMDGYREFRQLSDIERIRNLLSASPGARKIT